MEDWRKLHNEELSNFHHTNCENVQMMEEEMGMLRA
jgi:hypothetical protein